jgi:hypothetical protein
MVSICGLLFSFFTGRAHIGADLPYLLLYHKFPQKSRPVVQNHGNPRIFGIYDKRKSSVSVGLTHRGGAIGFLLMFQIWVYR